MLIFAAKLIVYGYVDRKRKRVPIGITGSTGRSTGEHLHITAKYKGKVFNPVVLFYK